MPTDPSFSLTKDEFLLIEAHLREQYQGVFDDKMIQAHLHEFVESSFADNLAAVIVGSSRPGETLLDIGAGYGAFVLSCRRHGLNAVGFELAAFEVEIAKQRFGRLEPSTDAATIFYKGDAGKLPFKNSSFDIVSLLNVLEHVPDYRSVLHEAVRVLRPHGRLFVVCPNYAAFRKEAHYHVPWLPLLPRRIAAAYLRFLGRNPAFFEHHIYYCTNSGVLNALRKLGTEPAGLDALRLEHPELVASTFAKRILSLVRKFHLDPLLRILLALNFCNPIKSSITVVAQKKDPS
jgi:2-polyprenyl-3-methyl-5-hydroxy-6-metoxy-1,4-benzoquinol methylase